MQVMHSAYNSHLLTLLLARNKILRNGTVDYHHWSEIDSHVCVGMQVTTVTHPGPNLSSGGSRILVRGAQRRFVSRGGPEPKICLK